MTTALASRALAGVAPGHHASCEFHADDVQRAVVGRFAVEALRRGERLVYRTDARREATVRSWLRAAGLDVKHLTSRHQLQLRFFNPAETVGFDPAAAVQALATDRWRARHDGFTGLAVMGELSYALGAADAEQLIAYEHAASSIFARADVVALCQFDSRSIRRDLRNQLVSAHGVRVDVGAHGATTTYAGLTVSEFESGVIAIAGEIDLAVESYFRARMHEHLPGNGDLVVDVGGVTFIDTTGCRVLHQLAGALPPRRRLVITRPTRAVVRALSLCGWLDHPGILVDVGSAEVAS